MAGLSAVLLVGTAPVFAGFEWKPPAEAPAESSASPGPAPAAMPQGSPAQGSSINWDNANTPQMPAQAVQGIEAIPLTSAEKKKMPPVASSPDVITGFGSDLPLIVALQQVVPQQYKVSLSPGVDGGVHVSWQGDKPWEQSLSDMLAPERLVFAIQGNTLVVKPSEGRGSSVSRAFAPSRKADMIPQDMISNDTNEEFVPAESVQPMAMSAQPMTIRRSNPAPAQEAAPMSAPMVMNSVPSSPHPSWPLPAVAPIPVQQQASAATVLQPAWHAEKGQTLKSTLEDWSKAAHVQLYWSTDYDYRLNGDFAYGGNFEEAVGKLLDQFSNVKPQPYGQLHRNPVSGDVLVINTYGTYN